MDIMDDEIIANSHEYLLAEAAVIKDGSQVHQAIEVLLDHAYTRKIYVVDDSGRLLGAISYLSLVRAGAARYKIRKEGFWSMLRYLKDMFADDVADLMKRTDSVTPDNTLRDAIKIMLETGETDVPVVDAENKVIGELRGMEIMRIGLESVKRGDEMQLSRIKEEREKKGIRTPKVDPVTLKPKSG